MELAKHHLFYTMIKLKLPLKNRVDDPEEGLAFDCLSDQVDANGNVTRVLSNTCYVCPLRLDRFTYCCRRMAGATADPASIRRPIDSVSSRPDERCADVAGARAARPRHAARHPPDPPRQREIRWLVARRASPESERLRRRRDRARAMSSTATDATLAGEAPEQVEEGDGHRVRIRCRRRALQAGGGLVPQQRNPERPSLGTWQLVDGGIVDGLEEIPDRRVREGRLGIRWSGEEHAIAAVLGAIDAGEPERGLAHAGLALEQQRRRGSSGMLEPGVDHRELACPADNDLVQGTPRMTSDDRSYGSGLKVSDTRIVLWS